jgi:hypothetical protein
MLGTASAAAVLAELHGVKGEKEMDLNGVRCYPTKVTYRLLSIDA